MRRTRITARLEHALLAAAVGFIAFIIVFGGPRSHSIGPETGIAGDHASGRGDAPAMGAAGGGNISAGVVLTRSARPERRIGASE